MALPFGAVHRGKPPQMRARRQTALAREREDSGPLLWHLENLSIVE